MATRIRSARDGCPGVLRLHAAADGHMGRVRLPGGRLDARALAALADAGKLGNGIVELTSRAGVQVRGLAPTDGQALAATLSDGGLLPAPTHERVRNILAPPLAGRTTGALAPVDEVLDALDRALCAEPALAELPGRFLFAVDDGTRVLAGLGADVEVVAEPQGFRLFLGARATNLVLAPQDVAAAAVRAAHGFLALRAHDDGRAWRVRELRDGPARLALDLGLAVQAGVHPGGSADEQSAPGIAREPVHQTRRLGPCGQRDGRFAVTALPPLGRLDPAQLTALVELAQEFGVAGVRVSPWRTLSVVDVPASVTHALAERLAELGLVTTDASGWTGLSACAGLRACARARFDVRAAAAERASLRDAESPIEHWSACERRCGEPRDVQVRVVAGEHGLEWM